MTDGDYALRAALQGLGYAYLFESMAEEALRDGRLVRVLDDWCAPFPGFFLYYPSRAQMPLKLRVFIDLLKGHVAGSPPA